MCQSNTQINTRFTILPETTIVVLLNLDVKKIIRLMINTFQFDVEFLNALQIVNTDQSWQKEDGCEQGYSVLSGLR